LERLSKIKSIERKRCADGHENYDFDTTTAFPLTQKVMV